MNRNHRSLGAGVSAVELVLAALLALSLLGWHAGWRLTSLLCSAAAALVIWRGDVTRNTRWYAATVAFPVPQALLATRLAFADLFALAAIGRHAGAAVRERRLGVNSTLTVPLLCLVAVFAMATVVGIVRTATLSPWALLNKDAGILLLVGIFMVLAATLRTLDDIKRIVQWFVAGVAIANVTSLVGVAAAFAGYQNDLYLIGNGRLYGWMGNPSINGAFMFTAGILELGLLMAPPVAGERRAWRWVNVWLLAIGVGLTLSRSTWLSVAAASATLLIAAAVHAARTREWRLGHVSAVAVWLVLPVLVLGNIVRARGGIEVTPPVTVAADLQARLIGQCLANPALDLCQQVQMPSNAAAPAPSAGAGAPSGDGRSASVEAAPPAAPPVTAPVATAGPPAKPPASDAPRPDLDGPLMNARGLNDRIAIASAALNQYLADPMTMVFGVGLGTFYATSGATFGVPLIIHNTFVWFLVEFGPLGLLVVLWIWGRTISSLWAAALTRNGGQYIASGTMAAFAGMTVFCILNEGLYQRQLWLLFAIADRLHAVAAAPVGQTTPASALPVDVAVMGRA